MGQSSKSKSCTTSSPTTQSSPPWPTAKPTSRTFTRGLAASTTSSWHTNSAPPHHPPPSTLPPPLSRRNRNQYRNQNRNQNQNQNQLRPSIQVCTLSPPASRLAGKSATIQTRSGSFTSITTPPLPTGHLPQTSSHPREGFD